MVSDRPPSRCGRTTPEHQGGEAALPVGLGGLQQGVVEQLRSNRPGCDSTRCNACRHWRSCPVKTAASTPLPETSPRKNTDAAVGAAGARRRSRRRCAGSPGPDGTRCPTARRPPRPAPPAARLAWRVSATSAWSRWRIAVVSAAPARAAKARAEFQVGVVVPAGGGGPPAAPRPGRPVRQRTPGGRTSRTGSPGSQPASAACSTSQSTAWVPPRTDPRRSPRAGARSGQHAAVHRGGLVVRARSPATSGPARTRGPAPAPPPRPGWVRRAGPRPPRPGRGAAGCRASRPTTARNGGAARSASSASARRDAVGDVLDIEAAAGPDSGTRRISNRRP